MNPADKTIQELTQSLHQSQETIEQLTRILSKSEKRSQLLERSFRWLAVLFICLTMTVFYVGFDWVNKAQATVDQAATAPAATPKTTPKGPGTPKQEVQSCRQGMQLMMVKQAQDIMLNSMTLSQEIQKLPQNNNKNLLDNMNQWLNSKFIPKDPKDAPAMMAMMDNAFKDNSRIFCQIFFRIDNLTRKVSKLQADWPVVRLLMIKRLQEIAKEHPKHPLFEEADNILKILQKKKIIQDGGKLSPFNKKNTADVDNALVTYLLLGVIKGLGSLDEVQQVLTAVPRMNTNMEYMNANMEYMNTHMYYMMRNMGVMSYDMDSTLGRAGRNMPWMPW